MIGMSVKVAFDGARPWVTVVSVSCVGTRDTPYDWDIIVLDSVEGEGDVYYKIKGRNVYSM
jgi:hypothetical protein